MGETPLVVRDGSMIELAGHSNEDMESGATENAGTERAETGNSLAHI